MNERLTEFPDRRVWDLSGFTLDQIRLDYQVTFLLSRAGSSMQVVIEQPITLHNGTYTIRIEPEMPLSVVPLLPLLHQEVTSLTAFRDGRLLIVFEEGSEIEVLKDDQYESWSTFGDGELASMGMLCSGHAGSPWGG